MRRRTTRTLLAALAALTLSCGHGSDGQAVGTLERDRLELIAEASEPIVEIAVREGDDVAAGTLILRLDPARFDAQVAQAEAARDRAAARVAELERGPRSQRITEGRARLAAAEGALVTAHSDLGRARRLLSSGVASTAQRDQAQAGYDEALGRRDAARADLDAMVEGTTKEEMAQARSAQIEAESALVDTRLRAARLELRAPVAGRVDALPFKLGERPPQGATVAVLLAEGAPYARVYVPEALRVHVVPGVAARVHVDGIAEPFAARVRTVASDASFTPYHALTERDRGRLVFVAEVDLEGEAARKLPTGVPVQVEFAL